MMQPLAHFLESCLAYVALVVFGCVPLRLHEALARLLAVVLDGLRLGRRKVLFENLDQAFGPMAPAERRQLVRGIYRHTIQLALEFGYLFVRGPLANIRETLARPFDGEEHFQEVLQQGEGFIIATAHLSNWEWIGHWLGDADFPVVVVTKPMHNAWSERLVQRFRQQLHMTVCSTDERVPRALIRPVRAGGAVCLVADQDAGRRGRFIPFFGTLASTPRGPAALTIALGVPLLLAFGVRTAPGRFKVVIEKPIRPDPNAPREQEEQRLLAAYNDGVERAIRRAPEQYFWWHRRWKTRPKKKKKSARRREAASAREGEAA